MSSDSKTLSNDGSPLPKDEQSNTKSSSICSLSLGEFHQTLFNDGKNIGSMNMDEFLNICTTEEENNTNDDDDDPLIDSNNKSSPSNQQNPRPETFKIIPNTQQNLTTSQGSLTLPTLLPMKTVEEVWSEMNKDQQQFNELKNSGNIHRQSTLGDMTLEDFLINAGVVVRKTCGGSSYSPIQMKNTQSNRQLESVQVQVRPIHRTNNSSMDPKAGLGFSDTNVSSGGIPAIVPQGGLIVGDPKLESGFHRGMWSGAFGMISPGGMCTSQVFNSARQFEVEVSGKRGKKRANEGPLWEKVVERRQRRMIKNREAASRSRARRQAYTVELEAALDKLKEENARLNQTLLQDKKEKHSKIKMPRITEKLKLLRRMWSFPLMEDEIKEEGDEELKCNYNM